MLYRPIYEPDLIHLHLVGKITPTGAEVRVGVKGFISVARAYQYWSNRSCGRQQILQSTERHGTGLSRC